MPLQQGDPPQIGRYRLTARLGSGGMGVVYLGQGDDGHQVAVKVLRPEYADDQEFRARFQREVSAIGRVRNRYCVRVLDADTESATPFLATDYAQGPSLDEHVKASGPLHPDAVFRLATALAEAIAAIHAAGVTHRDLKPSNVLLTNSGPMVIDFGIAQVADAVSITRTGMAIGSPGYMAPEQVTGHAGREADIFTWALILSYAASGQPPFGTGETVAILHRILNGRPDISAVPPQLMPVVTAALDKDPQRRPAAADLLQELQAPGSTAIMAAGPAAGGQTTRLDGPNDGFGPARTLTMAGNPGPAAYAAAPYAGAAYEEPGYGAAGYRNAGNGGPGPRRNWRAPAIAAVVLVAAVGVGAMMLTSNGSNGGHAPSGGTTPTATTSASPQQGATTAPVTQATASDGQQGNDNQQGNGQAKKTQGNGDSNGNTGKNGTGTGTGGSTPSTAPSILPSLFPSKVPSTAATSGVGGGAPSPSSTSTG